MTQNSISSARSMSCPVAAGPKNQFLVVLGKRIPGSHVAMENTNHEIEGISQPSSLHSRWLPRGAWRRITPPPPNPKPIPGPGCGVSFTGHRSPVAGHQWQQHVRATSRSESSPTTVIAAGFSAQLTGASIVICGVMRYPAFRKFASEKKL